MKDNLNKKVLVKAINYIVNFINTNNPFKNKNLLLDKSYKEFKYDDMLFFKSGQLLFLLYIFNINSLESEKIKYSNNTFYVLDLFSRNFNSNNLAFYDCESIARDFINNSVYTKEFLPIEITDIGDFEILEIQNGFKLSYNILVNEKISLIKDLENIEYSFLLSNLIKNLKLLNHNDLARQLKLIEIRFKNNCVLESVKNPFKNNYYEYQEFIKCQKIFTSNLIQNSIIGIENGEFSVTWLGFIENKIIPLGYRNIYIALFLGYLSCDPDNNHYIQPCTQAINTSIKDFNLNKKNLLYSRKLLELSNTLSAFYLLNKLISYEKLNSFIIDNMDLIDSHNFKKTIIEDIKTEKFINNYLKPLISPIIEDLFLIEIK